MHSEAIKIDGAWNEAPKGREGTWQLFGRWETLPKELFHHGCISAAHVLTICHTFHLSLTEETQQRNVLDLSCAGRDKENTGFLKQQNKQNNSLKYQNDKECHSWIRILNEKWQAKRKNSNKADEKRRRR